MEREIAFDSSYYDMQSVFLRGSTVRDIAEPLLSFDAGSPADIARSAMEAHGHPIAGIRTGGRINGYVLLEELGNGVCGEFARRLNEANVLAANTPLVDVVLTLAEAPFAFVRVLGQVGGFVTREDLQDPPVRMWLFGMVTIIEMYYLRMIEQSLPEGAWKQYLSDGRITKAVELLEERRRRGQNPRLLDCLQFGDKAQIVIRDETLRTQAGFQSRKRAERAMKMVERLRNNLAHTQDIVAWDWETIVVLAENIDRLLHWDQAARS